MWNESLIESMGAQNNSKRWLTVQLAAIVHAAIVGVLVTSSFWYVDRVSLPTQERISAVYYERMPGGPPPALGVRKQQPNETSEIVKPVSAPTELVQEQLIPETINNISDSKIADVFVNNLPSGDPEGIPGGDPNSNSTGGIWGAGGNGIGTAPIDTIYHSSTVNLILPVIIDQIKPNYPEPLRRIRREGIVILEAVIRRTGSVHDVRLLKSAHPLFDQEAMTAVRQWKYRPATLSGKPVPVYFTVTVSFRLR